MSDLLRHEQYLTALGDLPFVLQADIERTPHNRSNAQNWHEEIEIELCTDGRGEVLLGGRLYDFEKGDVIIVNSNLLHHTGSRGSVTYTCLIPRIEFCRTVGLEPSALRFSEKIRDERLSELIVGISREYLGEGEHRTLGLCEKLMKLLALLVREYSTPAPEHHTAEAHLLHVRRAISFIHENYKRKFSIDEIARMLYIDKYRLCREFRHATGDTIVGYANSYRVHNAAMLISSGVRVSEAARECGFDNLSFFTKTFKKYMERKPSDLKRANVKQRSEI